MQDISGRWTMVEIANSEHIYKADLVLIALGFTGPGKTLTKELGLKMVK
jgi:NADPH-dependent glutamate synthase beta subunit-like oxidoreductase